MIWIFRRKRSVADIPEGVLTPDTVDELPIALPVMSRLDRQEVEEPGWIERSAQPWTQR